MFTSLFTGVLALSALAQAAPSVASPTVKIKNGTVVGSSSGGIDSFSGIPFAQPPVGNLRLRPPVPLSKGFGTLQATAQATTCPQLIVTSPATGDVNSGPNGPFGPEGENCLNLNVQRPSNVKKGSKVPVIAWIFGGGFELGSTNQYPGDVVIQRAVNLSKPIVYVAMNYRLGGFGFLAGNDLKKEGSTNLGLRDQRLALQWIAENIAEFGGDPDQVTLWGESAGAISITDQLLINNGSNLYKGKPLFKAAFQDSGSIVPAYDVGSEKPQAIYNTVLSYTNCTNAADHLACLRKVPYNDFYRAVTRFPTILGYTALNLAFLPRPDNSSLFFPLSPELAVIQNRYTPVPTVLGDQEDEGTLFAQYALNLTTTQDLYDYFKIFFPTAGQDKIAQLVDAYPDDPTQGSPFRTGNLYSLGPQYKRLAAILGDITFTLIRRAYLSFLTNKVPAWSYLSSYNYNQTSLGTAHGSDLPIIRSTEPGIPRDSYLNYLISFAYYQDPTKIKNPYSNVVWPRWNFTAPQLLSFEKNKTSLIPDNFRNNQYFALLGELGYLRI